MAARFVDAVSPQRGHLLRRTLDPANFATAAVTDVDVLVVGGDSSDLITDEQDTVPCQDGLVLDRDTPGAEALHVLARENRVDAGNANSCLS